MKRRSIGSCHRLPTHEGQLHFKIFRRSAPRRPQLAPRFGLRGQGSGIQLSRKLTRFRLEDAQDCGALRTGCCSPSRKLTPIRSADLQAIFDGWQTPVWSIRKSNRSGMLIGLATSKRAPCRDKSRTTQAIPEESPLNTITAPFSLG